MDTKADITDAPERVILRHHRQNAFCTAICLMIGSLAAVGAIWLVDRSSSLDSAHKQMERPTEKDQELTRVPSQGRDSSWLRASTEVYLPDNAVRQTVFNDQNFVPKGAENVIAFRVSSELTPRPEAPKKAKLTIVRQPPSMKERVCYPYRQGSTESRNCRASVGLKRRD